MSCSTFRNLGGSSCGKNDDKSQSSACEVGERFLSELSACSCSVLALLSARGNKCRGDHFRQERIFAAVAMSNSLSSICL
jgi:hypothetical protein